MLRSLDFTHRHIGMPVCPDPLEPLFEFGKWLKEKQDLFFEFWIRIDFVFERDDDFFAELF